MGSSSMNAVIHALNALFCLGFYLIGRWLITRNRKPPAERDAEEEEGSKKESHPEYKNGPCLYFLGTLALLAGVPSFEYCVSYGILKAAVESDSIQENMPDMYIQNDDLILQLMVTSFMIMHTGLRYWYNSLTEKRHAHAAACLYPFRFNGNERCLVIRCGYGFWLNQVAHHLTEGGKVTGEDDWGSHRRPQNAKWTIENARRDGVSARVIVEVDPKDPTNLDIRDECVDIVINPLHEENNEPSFFLQLCEMHRVLKPGGKLGLILPMAEPSVSVELLEELGYTKIKEYTFVNGYLMNKILIGHKSLDAGALHAKDGEGAKCGINVTDSDWNNQSPGMAGVGLKLMLVFLTFVGLYGCCLFSVFLYYEWDQFDAPSDHKPENRFNGGLMVPMSIWSAFGFIAVWFELKQRPKWTVRRVGVVKLWGLYTLQYVGAALLFAGLQGMVHLKLEQYTAEIQMMVCLTMIFPTWCWGYLMGKLRVFYTMQAWRSQFGARPEGAESRLKIFVESPSFNWFIFFFIILGGVLIGVATDKAARESSMVVAGEYFVLFVFTVEAILRMVAEYPKVWMYFVDVWNLFDFGIVLVGIIGIIVKATSDDEMVGAMMVIRLFRLVRLFKLFRQVQGLRITALVMLNVLKPVTWTFLILLFLIYIFACSATYSFQHNDQKYFGTLFHSFLACVSVLSNRWIQYFNIEFYGCDKVYTVQEREVHGCDPDRQPVIAVVFFPLVVLVMTYMFLNVIVGVIIIDYDYSAAKVKLDDWNEMEEEDPGSGGVLAPEVAALRSRLNTVALLKQLKNDTQALKSDAAKFRRMTLYLRPRY